jgi:uncharacterized protein YrrD
MSDPVSWLVIEKGWKVLDPTGEEIGQVEEIVGDTGTDIFNGLKIHTGILSESRYVPAERVTEIKEGCVALDVTKDAIAEFDDAWSDPR